ncbi:oleosin 16.4 kDa-like isoform X1 [Juglans microcarpa x Juglans regia]|uniref:oleosin 16.4 kDa-like isoform X1 n=1 Tax=Juglans microcarpa x Juglans regia TaxID=2249226 RepID=UPI001B7DDAFB|nr:oleosin 16.4 kDa-like isoform X1 [Juglans microcarpa x Juglans regia]
MADRPQQLQFPQRHYNGGPKSQRGPSAVKVIAVLGGLLVGGTLLALAGLTLIGSVIGLAITTPLFIICSPVLVPAAIVMGLAIAGFFSSGALGLTGLASLSRVFNYLRQASRSLPQEMDQAKRRKQDMTAYVGQKTKETGQDIQSKAQEGRRT